jgi:hypothetical protein
MLEVYHKEKYFHLHSTRNSVDRVDRRAVELMAIIT